MGKGIIKVTGIGGTTVKTTTTVDVGGTVVSGQTQYDGTTPPGDVVTGTIDDLVNPGQVYNFQQPFGLELGLFSGAKVNFNTVTVNGQQIANMVKLLDKGVVQSINDTNDGGTLLDKASKTVIPFSHPYCKESMIVGTVGTTKGSIVNYERIIDPNTATVVATALELVK